MTVAQLLDGQIPWWASAFATVLLSLAAAVARRVTRHSARPQGERIGRTEALLKLEQTRRRQTEATLIALGVPLPIWPPDGPNQPRPILYARQPRDWREDVPDRPDDGDDLDDYLHDLRTAEAPRPPVPPIPPDEAERFARHRREAHHQ